MRITAGRGRLKRSMRPAISRALCVAWLALPLLVACSDPMQLVLVAAAGSNALSQAGSDAGGALSLGGFSGGGGGAAEPSAGEPAAGGEPGVAGAFTGPPWEAPTLYTASYVSHAFPGQYLRHVTSEGFVGAVDMASAFEILPGIWDDSCISFRAVEELALLRHAGARQYLHPFTDVPLYKADATYCPEPGFADPEGVSFRSINYQQRLIRVRANGEVWNDYIDATPEFASESTFYRETALSERN